MQSWKTAVPCVSPIKYYICPNLTIRLVSHKEILQTLVTPVGVEGRLSKIRFYLPDVTITTYGSSVPFAFRFKKSLIEKDEVIQRGIIFFVFSHLHPFLPLIYHSLTYNTFPHFSAETGGKIPKRKITWVSMRKQLRRENPIIHARSQVTQTHSSFISYPETCTEST